VRIHRDVGRFCQVRSRGNRPHTVYVRIPGCLPVPLEVIVKEFARIQRVGLTVGDGGNETIGRNRAVVDHSLSHGLLTHEITKRYIRTCEQTVRDPIPQHTSIRCQPCDRNSDVIIYAIHLLLIRSQLSSRSLLTIRAWVSGAVVIAHLECQKNGMGFRAQAHGR